jgi:hypothetical protein
MGMFEYEAIKGEAITHRDPRASTYVSMFWQVADRMKLISSTYYLPRLDQFRDYRLRTDTQLQLQLLQWLQYKASVSWLYDTRPPAAIPRHWITLKNGLAVNF